MATRARIGIENGDGSVLSIYTHWDGYPEHHGPILLETYADEESASALIALGDLSILGRDLGEAHDFDSHEPDSDVCLAYGRDRGEAGVDAIEHDADDWPDSGHEYEYLYRSGVWYFRPRPWDGEGQPAAWELLTSESREMIA